MDWRQVHLQPASFRGATFHVIAARSVVGRRTVTHEYPLRDLPFVEDIGRQARRMRIEAVLIGDDYMRRRDALIAAVEQPGPGTLVHPYFGELEVSIDEGGVQIEESTAQGGMASISFAVIESGAAVFPSAHIATAEAVSDRAGDAHDAAASGFDADFIVAGLPAFAVESSLRTVNDALDHLDGLLGLFPALGSGRDLTWSLLSALRRDAPGLLKDALALAQRLRTLYASVRASDDPMAATQVLGAVASFVASQPATSLGTPSRRREARNQVALVAHVHCTAAIERCHTLTDVVFTTYEDAVEQRDSVVAQLDGVADETPHDAVYQALSDLRTATQADIAGRTVALTRLRDHLVPQTLPAWVLAYDLYTDPGRESELVALNALPRPGFVPGGHTMRVPVDG